MDTGHSVLTSGHPFILAILHSVSAYARLWNFPFTIIHSTTLSLKRLRSHHNT
jgi:hypothetical protein